MYAGFRGDFCNKECPRGYYGEGCMSKCSCENGATCAPETGQCICTKGTVLNIDFDSCIHSNFSHLKKNYQRKTNLILFISS
jgi:hypothetical protein